MKIGILICLVALVVLTTARRGGKGPKGHRGLKKHKWFGGPKGFGKPRGGRPGGRGFGPPPPPGLEICMESCAALEPPIPSAFPTATEGVSGPPAFLDNIPCGLPDEEEIAAWYEFAACAGERLLEALDFEGKGAGGFPTGIPDEFSNWFGATGADWSEFLTTLPPPLRKQRQAPTEGFSTLECRRELLNDESVAECFSCVEDVIADQHPGFLEIVEECGFPLA